MSQALKRSVTLSFTPAQYAWSSLMPRFLLSGNVVRTGARLGSMYLYALGLVGPLGMNGAKAAMRLALDANLMNSRQRSALGPPFRMHQPSMAHRFWSQEIFTAPPVHQTTTSFLTRSSTLNARSRSHG